MSPVAGKTLEDNQGPAGYKLTDLPPGREVNAFAVLHQYQSLGTDLADAGAARHVQNSYQVMLEQLLIMMQSGQIDANCGQAMINTIVGMNQAVGEACYAVGNASARIRDEADSITGAQPAAERPRRTIRSRFDL